MKKLFFIFALFFSINSFGAISISPSTISGLTVGIPYTLALNGTGGTPDYLIWLSAGTLPAGTSIVYNGGQGGDAYLYGTPSTAATYTFQLKCRDSKLNTGTRNYTVTVVAGSAGTVTSVAINAGASISISGSPITSSGTITVTNTAPNRTVTITGAGSTTVTGTYPTYTITGASTPTTVVGDWHTTGNSGTTAGTNFLGTTDNIDLIFKRNSIQSGLLNESSHNTSFGISALLPATTGTEITAIGYGALQSNTSGVDNTAVGYVALGSNTTALGSTAMGYSALSMSTGGENTAYGWKSLRLTTAGTTNVGFGVKTLENNTIGIDNTAVGVDVCLANIDGNYNTGVGMNALISNITGDFNTAVGMDALYNNTADENIAVGRRALYTNTTGTGNTAIGTVCLFSNNTTSFNTAIGYASLLSNVASNNTAVGYNSLTTNSTGIENCALGKESMNNNSSGSDNVSVGFRSLFANTGDNNTALGAESGRLCTGSGDLFLGRYAGFWQTSVSNLGVIDDRLRADAIDELKKSPVIITFGLDSSVQSVKFNSQLKLTSGINTTAGDAATINAQSGRFRKDATGSSFILTNAYITANSIIVLTNVTTGITTGNQLSIQAGSGSATITFETSGVAAAPSANMDVNFILINNL
jgi:hypothetical protein